jgi:hypothetical protein
LRTWDGPGDEATFNESLSVEFERETLKMGMENGKWEPTHERWSVKVNTYVHTNQECIDIIDA